PAEPAAPPQRAAVVNPSGFVPRPNAPPPPGPAELSVHQGSRLFQRTCVICHGADGRGSGVRATMPAIPNFTERAWQEQRPDPRLVVSILEGKGTDMPAFRDKVSREQARDLVAFLRTFAPAAAPQPAAATGAPDDFEARFRQLLEEFASLRRQGASSSPPSGQPRSQTPAPPRGTGSRPPQSQPPR